MPRPKVPCRVCGDLRYVGRGSLAQPTCLKCRRAHGRPASTPLHPCQVCEAPIAAQRVFCNVACRRRTGWGSRPRTGPKASSTSRGYGAEHQRLRRELLPKAIGEDCPRCGAIMLAGQPLTLDHTDDRTGYLGITHRWCNARHGWAKSMAARRAA